MLQLQPLIAPNALGEENAFTSIMHHAQLIGSGYFESSANTKEGY